MVLKTSAAPEAAGADGVKSTARGVPASQARTTKATYAFGPYLLDGLNSLLYRASTPVELPPKTLETLYCLVVNQERVVTRDMLFKVVWGGSAVGENNIAQHIYGLRKALDDMVKPYKFIATVHGRGFRFIGNASRVIGQHEGSQVSAAPGDFATEIYINAGYFARLGTPAALDSSAHLCRKAILMAPAFSDAFAQLAHVSILRAAFLYNPPMHQFELARHNAAVALRIDPACARAHSALAALALMDDLDYENAHRHLDAADAALPGLLEARILRILAFTALGDHESAKATAYDALTAYPASSAAAAYSAFALYHAGDLDAAADRLKRLLIFRAQAAFPTYLLALVHLAQERFAEARDEFQTLLLGRASHAYAHEKFRQRAVAGLSYIEAKTGSLEDAAALAEDLERSTTCSHVALALARAGAGQHDAVMACLREARNRRDPWFPFVAYDPMFRDYHSTSEFQELAS